MKRNQLGTILLALCVATGIASAQAPFGEGIPSACLVGAKASAVQWKLQGKSPVEVDKLFQEALARCSGADLAAAKMAGLANFDYSRFARMVMSGAMPPNLYLALVRDRSRKLRAARQQPSIAVAFLQGDADGDLVPNSKDLCTNTPDLTPTTDTGCPDPTPLPQAPYFRDIKEAGDLLGVVACPACSAAPAPEVSGPVKAGYDPVAIAYPLVPYSIAVSKVTNQPANCRIFYEVEVELSNPVNATFPATQSFHMVFRDSENIDFGSQTRQRFRILATAKGDRKALQLNAWNYRKQRIKVRSMNANGLIHGWSAPLVSTHGGPPQFGLEW